MLELFDKYKEIIEEYHIELWENEPTSFRFKARILFIDETILFVKDYVLKSGRKYAYHWQKADGTLIIRWDNAPHWHEVNTFPFHKHIESSQNVFAPTEVWIEEILEFIQKEIEKLSPS